MLSILLMVGAFSLLTIVFLLITHHDYFSPSVALPLMFLLCSSMALYNYFLYGTEVSSSAAELIIAGTAFFSVISLFISRACSPGFQAEGHWGLRDKAIDVPVWLLLVASIFCLVAMALYYRDLKAAMGSLGLSGDWNQSMNAMRMKQSLKLLDDGEGISGPVNFLYKIQTALGFVFAYIGLHNLLIGKRSLRAAVIFCPTAINAITALLTGGRMGVIRLVFGCLCIAWVLWNSASQWKTIIKISAPIKAIAAVILASVLFWLAGTAVGRQIDRGPLDYIASYIGFSPTLFSMYLKDGVQQNTLFGEETFVGLYNFFGSHFGIRDFVYTYHMEWRYLGSLNLGNVYTAYRYWYNDFGCFGMFVMTAAYALFYSVFYTKAKNYKGSSLINYPLLMYSYFVYGLFLIPIKDCLLATELVITTPFILFVMYALGKFIESKQ